MFREEGVFKNEIVSKVILKKRGLKVSERDRMEKIRLCFKGHTQKTRIESPFVPP